MIFFSYNIFLFFFLQFISFFPVKSGEKYFFNDSFIRTFSEHSVATDEQIALFEESAHAMGLENIPYFVIPGWENLSAKASYFYSDGNHVIISDSSIYTHLHIESQNSLLQHELGHGIVYHNNTFNQLVNGYALSKEIQILYGAGFLAAWTAALYLYSYSKKLRNKNIKSSTKSKTYFDIPELVLLGFFTIPFATVNSLSSYVQLNESMADALAITKGGASSSSFSSWLTPPSTNILPAKEIIYISQQFFSSCDNSIPFLLKGIKKFIPIHPPANERIHLAIHLENKYPNGIETINEQTIKQLRTDILKYNKISLCAEYALYAAAGYLTYKTVRMCAEDDLLPYSSNINSFFEKVDQKVVDCKVFVKNKISQSLEYFSSKGSNSSEN